MPFISILQLNSDTVKEERDVDVVGEEDCTDARMDEVYRPAVLSIKTEHEVGFVMKFFCGVCVYNSGFVLLADFAYVRQLFLVYSGKQLNYEDVDIQGVPKPMSQTSPGCSPPLIKQKSSYQHGSKSKQVPRYPLCVEIREML